jgi:hypothetical protein
MKQHNKNSIEALSFEGQRLPDHHLPAGRLT